MESALIYCSVLSDNFFEAADPDTYELWPLPEEEPCEPCAKPTTSGFARSFEILCKISLSVFSISSSERLLFFKNSFCFLFFEIYAYS